MATPTIAPQQLAPVLGSLVTALQSLMQTLQGLAVPQGAPAAVAGAAGGAAALGGGPSGPSASANPAASAGRCACCGSSDAVAGAAGAGPSAAPPMKSGMSMGAPTQSALLSSPSKSKNAPDKKDGASKKSKHAPAKKGGAPAKKGAASARDAQGPTTDLPRKNPRSFAQMKSWIEDQVKNPSMSYYRLCLGLTARAYGWKASGTASASEAWKTMPAAQKHAGDRNPPPGSLVFYSTGSPAGHVAIYMGNGKVASNDILRKGKVDIVDMKTIESKWGAKYLGWTPPYFPKA